MQELKNKDIIGLIYQGQEKVLDEKIRQVNQKIKEQIKDINISKLLEDSSMPDELKKAFEKIEKNYSIKIAEYTKEFYKQGVLDGVNLMINCLK